MEMTIPAQEKDSWRSVHLLRNATLFWLEKELPFSSISPRFDNRWLTFTPLPNVHVTTFLSTCSISLFRC